MNDRAEAYLREHGVVLAIDGHSELVLPLDKIQPFLDLLGPADVPPEKLQDLYRYQTELVAHIQAQTHSAGPADGEYSRSVGKPDPST